MTMAPPAAPGQTAAPVAAALPGGPPHSSLLAAWWTLYALTLRQHLHGKRWMVLAALFLLPAGLAILVRLTAPDVPAAGIEFLLSFMFIPQAVLPLVALIYASGIIQDEQEEQTITYLLVRPIPKWSLYVGKLLATWTTAIALTAIFTALTYAAIYVGQDSSVSYSGLPRCAQAAAIHALAVASYCCLFGLLSLLTARTLIVGIVYTAVVEGVLANLPFGIRLITVIYHTRLIAYRTMDFLVPTPRGPVDAAAEAWQLNRATDPQLLEHPQLATSLAVLLLGSLACTALAAWRCSRQEFHVKTPEKS